jgi:aminomethyltransferase
MKRTPLYDSHLLLGAKMVEFAGWEMPVHYKGIIQEHKAVRERVGIFDVSHMGRVVIEGKEAESFLDYLSTNQIRGKEKGSATYTIWCNEWGGSIDDLILYKQHENHLFVVVNASNRQKDLEHLLKESGNFDVKIEPKYESEGILAIQGPRARYVVSQIFEEANVLKTMHFLPISYHGQELILSATGYTGAGGFEIYAPIKVIREIWSTFLLIGKSEEIEAVGLGARDTLRLEMGYALYGHELTEQIAPTESVSRWAVKWDKDFLGKRALEELEESSKRRFEYGVILKDRGIAREGYQVYRQEELIGRVTSGTMAPSLNQAIAIILVDRKLKEGDNVAIQIRTNRCRAEVVKLPFYQT